MVMRLGLPECCFGIGALGGSDLGAIIRASAHDLWKSKLTHYLELSSWWALGYNVRIMITVWAGDMLDHNEVANRVLMSMARKCCLQRMTISRVPWSRLGIEAGKCIQRSRIQVWRLLRGSAG
jgi:hypothetical protein